MDQEKFIMVSLKEDKTKNIADVINNKTCKKMLDLLAETGKKELSQEDISKELSLPLNTIGYNVKKLVEAGLITESKNFFWSRKGKKIKMYKLSNKFIIIAPRKKSTNVLKALIPTVIISGVAGFLIKICYKANYFVQKSAEAVGGIEERAVETAVDFGEPIAVESVTKSAPGLVSIVGSSDVWLFFLLGALFGLAVFLILNWRKL